MTIGQAMGLAALLVDSESATLDTSLLLAEVLKVDRSYLYTWPERVLTLEQEASFQALMTRRQAGEPVAHLLRRREFWSLPLQVNNATLIPRPDTELLVEVALAIIQAQERIEPFRVLDLGTGTGAIALAIASDCPRCAVLAVDWEAGAVALAELNRQTLGLDNVQVQTSDWFAQVAGRFSLIVSNPPYLDSADPHLAQGDVRFEPRSALIAEEGGLADLKTIVCQAPDYLHPGGFLLLEHGYGQGPAVRALLADAGFSGVRTHRDLAGHERVSGGQYHAP